ncbi:uncharacterized protein LOC133841967 [Drosophila sulfurigaster albostrigata]|uniref:uncharacterized protein LOC133841967 n=1 Tax=Drosophila sulfurigaster albostrigata TaxID=89887 RepID=UPI002D21BB1B|nr:uncharacterized protein LOC133841967 [Drosophila sulfurigaster albostrigata]
MQLLHLLFTLLIFIESSQSSSIQDPNDIDLEFIHAAKELVSFVRLDIKKLNRRTRQFIAADVRQNQLKVIQHLKNVKEKLDQIEELHLTLHEKKLYYNFGDGSYLEGAIDWISFDLDLDFCENCSEETLLSLTKKPALLKFTFFMYKNDFYKELHGIVCDYDYILVKCVRTQLNRWTKIYELPLNAMCKARQSPQQLFYSFYKDIALAELKAYILIEYGLMIHRVTRNLHFYKRRMNLLRNYDELTERALKTLSNVVEKADRVLFRCDPPLQKGNITLDVDEIRYFNLRETLSDVKVNKVVTGVRFVKSNRVFHLQIQQGQLLPRGFIKASTVEWKPLV